MRLPGPTDLLAAAVTVKDGVVDVADLWPRALDLVDRVEAMVARGETLLDQAEVLLTESAATRERVQRVADGAARTAERVDALVDRAAPLLGDVLDEVDPDALTQALALLDRLPLALAQLDQIAPDVHEILASVTDLTHAAQGMPGVMSLMRRGARKDGDPVVEA